MIENVVTENVLWFLICIGFNMEFICLTQSITLRRNSRIYFLSRCNLWF